MNSFFRNIKMNDKAMCEELKSDFQDAKLDFVQDIKLRLRVLNDVSVVSEVDDIREMLTEYLCALEGMDNPILSEKISACKSLIKRTNYDEINKSNDEFELTEKDVLDFIDVIPVDKDVLTTEKGGIISKMFNIGYMVENNYTESNITFDNGKPDYKLNVKLRNNRIKINSGDSKFEYDLNRETNNNLEKKVDKRYGYSIDCLANIFVSKQFKVESNNVLGLEKSNKIIRKYNLFLELSKQLESLVYVVNKDKTSQREIQKLRQLLVEKNIVSEEVENSKTKVGNKDSKVDYKNSSLGNYKSLESIVKTRKIEDEGR